MTSPSTNTSGRVPPARIVISKNDRDEVLALVDTALASGALTLGPLTARFEAAFSALHGGGHAVAVSSGTAALEIVFRSLGVQGQDVIVPSNTFYATAGAVVHAGGRPALADVDAATLMLSAATVEAALTPATVGVVVVHIGGAVCPDIEGIAELCRHRGIWLVEDAAHAHGSSLRGQSAGTFGIASTFSFYPTKVVTSGEGGMILTSSDHLRDEAILYRDQGKAGFLGGDHVRLGYAWRLSELHAAVGLTQMGRLESFVARRREVAAAFDEALAGLDGISAVTPPTGSCSNYYKYVALLDPGIDRAAFKAEMSGAHGVAMSGEVYASPLHAQPVFAELAHGPLPVAEDVCARHVCLPVLSDMSDAEVEQVIAAVAVVARKSIRRGLV